MINKNDEIHIHHEHFHPPRLKGGEVFICTVFGQVIVAENSCAKVKSQPTYSKVKGRCQERLLYLVRTALHHGGGWRDFWKEIYFFLQWLMRDLGRNVFVCNLVVRMFGEYFFLLRNADEVSGEKVSSFWGWWGINLWETHFLMP